MKKFLNIFIVCVSSLLVLNSCEAEHPYYDGDSYVHFLKESQDIYAVSGTPHIDTKILYGAMRPVSGDHQVKLVLDTEKSTAVEGLDFQILNDNVSNLASGTANGEFSVRVITSQMSETPKVAVFKVVSATIPTAVFNDKIVVNMSLTCPMSSFLGSGYFTNNIAVWMAPAGSVYKIEDISTGTTHKLAIREYMDDGSDLILNYDPVTFKVSIPLQATGYVNSAGTQIAHASDPSTGAASFYNPCTRVLTLKVYWHARNPSGQLLGGYFSAPQTEVFTGN